MNSATAPSPVLFFDTINAYQKSAALKAAIELDLFTAIGREPATATELAARCGHPHRGVRILADYLTILGFLTKEEGEYALTEDSAVFLDRNSPAYLGESVEFFLAPQLTESFESLSETVRRGRKADAGTTEHDHQVWVRFARVMAPLMVAPAAGAAQLVTLDQSRDTRILDVSASHGIYGITLAQMNSRAHLVALDWKAVLELTEENARRAGLGERFSKIAGSAFTADLGSDYDVILVPNFLHHFSRAECVSFLKRTHAALRPGGKVVIIEFVPNVDRVTPPDAAGFSLVMLGSTPEGDAYTFSEYEGMLSEAGFPKSELHQLPPSAECAVIASKPV